MRRVGLFGGTFNPPHVAHLLMANEVAETLQLDEVRFMPNAVPPHKIKEGDATAMQRLEMTRLAIANNVKFVLEPFEIERGGVSYSYETMQQLTKREPDVQFYFIIGGDSIAELHTWYHIEELVKLVRFVGVGRPGYVGKSIYDVEIVEAPLMDLSSTLIRERLKKGTTVKYLLPEAVEQYIREEGLYGTRSFT
ncbi:nicotinate-nucleotide adenylyltransferase [Kurthia senegalensis]|uniref:nicotinate-nucleotide adenylyltransferase n=1 Tax=Kurthia senegalensis TaxID=1033740 RepID=UPI000474A995|nr:nicotinate-nucleotide adenylyltransferase [Kurthia senegalensis]